MNARRGAGSCGSSRAGRSGGDRPARVQRACGVAHRPAGLPAPAAAAASADVRTAARAGSNDDAAARPRAQVIERGWARLGVARPPGLHRRRCSSVRRISSAACERCTSRRLRASVGHGRDGLRPASRGLPAGAGHAGGGRPAARSGSRCWRAFRSRSGRADRSRRVSGHLPQSAPHLRAADPTRSTVPSRLDR